MKLKDKKTLILMSNVNLSLIFLSDFNFFNLINPVLIAPLKIGVLSILVSNAVYRFMIKKVKVWSEVNVGFIALLFFVVNHFAFKDVVLNNNSANHKIVFDFPYNSNEANRSFDTEHHILAQDFFLGANEHTIFTLPRGWQLNKGRNTFEKVSASIRPEVNLAITAGTQSSDTDIFYIEGTTTGFDNGYDSSIFEGIAASFSLYTNTVTHSAGRKLGIQCLPNSGYKNMVIPIGVKAALGTEITFSATAMNLPAGIKVFLEDRDTNIFTELALANTAYNVRLTEETNGVGRFYLHTKQEVLNVSWNGSADSDWLNAANWSTGIIPAVNAIVTIPSGLTQYPTASGAVSVHSIILNSGSSFIANSTFVGSLTYNRTLGANWHLVSSPVVGETLQGMIANNSFVVGTNIIGLAPYVNDTDQWDYLTSTATGTFTAAGGYSAKLAAAGDVSFTGTMPTENSSVAINQGTTNNYNLVGNPYPSFVTVSALLAENESSLTENTLWVWHPNDNSGVGAYSIVNAVTGIAYIAPAQGFFVSANANADNTFSFTETMQSHQSADTFQKTATETRPEINLLITTGTERSDTNIFYIEGTTTGFDTGYDSSIFEGSALGFSLYTHAVTNSTGRKLGVQTLPNSGYAAMVIPLGVKAVSGAEITFSAAAIHLPAGTNVFLEDREANVFTELTDSNTNYKVRLTEGAAELGRFYLHTKQQVLSVVEKEALSKVKMYKTTNTNLRLAGMSQGKAMVKVYNVVGQELMSTVFVSSSVSNIGLPNLSKGVYLVKLETEAGILNKKIVIE